MSLAALVLCFVLTLICVTVPGAGKGIYVTVQAPWNETALLQEGCEWAARRLGNEGFFNCLEQVWKRQQLSCHGGNNTSDETAQVRASPHSAVEACAAQGARAMTQQAQYILAKDVIASMPYVTEDDLELFAMQMAARVYSPAVEAHYTLAVLDAIPEQRQDDDEQQLGKSAAVPEPSPLGGCTGEPFVILVPAMIAANGGAERSRNAGSSGDHGRYGRIVTKPAALAAALRSIEPEPKDGDRAMHGAQGVNAPRTMHPVTTLLSQDHEYVRHIVPGGDDNDDAATEARLAYRLPTALLYGLVGEAQTLVWYTTLVEAHERGAIGGLIFRHLPVSVHRLCGPERVTRAMKEEQQWLSPLVVPGYGATVDLKSVEYKAVDERQSRGGSEAETSNVPRYGLGSAVASQQAVLRDEAGGFNVQRLRERYVNLTTPLTVFANSLEEMLWSEVETAVDFRVWELQNMGMAAVQYISEAPLEQRFATLHRLVTQFPLYAARLARMAAEPRRYMHIAHEVNKVRAVLSDGVSGLFLDGRYIRADDLSLFSLLRRIDVEEDLLRSLQRLLTHTPSRAAAEVKEVGDTHPRINRKGGRDDGGDGGAAALLRAVYKLRKTARAFDGTVIGDVNKSRAVLQDEEEELRTTAMERVYVAPEHIIWINDIETDKYFASLPRALSVILRSTAYGAQHMPRRNLLSLVILFDPTTQEGVYTVLGALNLLQQGIVVNIGLVVVDRDWSETFTSELSDAREVHGDSARSLVTSIVAVTMSQLWHSGHKERILSYLVRLVRGTERNAAGELAEPAVRTFSELILRTVTDLTLDELLADEAFTRQYHITQSVIQHLNILTLPVMLLNGIPIASVQAFEREWQAEMAILRLWVRQGLLKDSDTALYDTILRLHDATTHLQRALSDARPMFAWDTAALLDFLHKRPFLYPVSAVPGTVALVSHVILLPPAAKAHSTLQLLVPALHSLESCQGYSQLKRTMCEAMRTSIISCPTPRGAVEAASGGAAAQLERVMQHVATLPEPRDGVGLVRRYIEVALRVTASLRPNVSLYDGASAVPESMLPAELRNAVADASLLGRRRAGQTTPREQAVLTQHLCQVATERLGLTGQTVAPMLISNGLVVSLDSTFTELDHVLAAQMQHVIASKVRRTLEELDLPALVAAVARDGDGGDDIGDGAEAQLSSDDLDSAFYAARTAALSSVLAVDATQYTQNTNILSLLPPHEKLPRSALHITPPNGQPARHRLLAIVDPAERTAQTLVALCDFLLRSPLPVELTLYLNPTADLTRPVRNFYDYVAETALRFDARTGAVVPPAAVFHGLPARQLLTLGVEEPEAWTVFAHEAEDDLDNLLLARLPNETRLLPVAYRIQSLLVTGEARDAESVTGVASGLPLTLRTRERVVAASGDGGSHGRATVQTRMHDTIVMANLGYFQLRAAPGMWWLSLQPGPFETAYHIRAVDGRPVASATITTAEPQRHRGVSPDYIPGERIAVLVNTFEGRFLRLDIRHTSGASTVSGILRAAEEATPHTWPPVLRGANATRARPTAPTLNVFSVASGHLYERFLRMMMYSVYNASVDRRGANTTRIKFWLLENYLSPQFKAYVPRMAAHYGYEVEFVTYHWPWWLLRQTEKQRKIWAYKILFLDVLFPLDVDRVIFVDADQSMQADLHELYNMDIDEHAIAMTPFCEANSNKLTEKFRFWRSGFWPKQLHGRPYHISALFLVDLLRFRRLGAGDTYRATYNQLVPDPKSLANLDQDLPNFLQDFVPIFSLPEEWLWCETWCSAESKPRAKTIDLCNNPLTKIPKLESAKAVIPHWQELDNELERVANALLYFDRDASKSS